MNAAIASAIIAGLGFALTCATMIFVAGRYHGAVTAQLDDIERRLLAIEGWLDKLGVTVLRKSDLHRPKP